MLLSINADNLCNTFHFVSLSAAMQGKNNDRLRIVFTSLIGDDAFPPFICSMCYARRRD
jgi:hypothetical protein